MQASTEKDTKINLLQKEFREMEGLVISYALYQISALCDYFAVEISSGDEQDMRILGNDGKRAQRLFEIFVNETVTPCTLGDILHDITVEEEGKRHRQNLCKI